MAAKLWGSAYPAASSILAYPEGRAALAAARRLDRLGEDEHREALAVFEELYVELATVGVDQELAVRAGGYAEDLGLRGGNYQAAYLLALELPRVTLNDALALTILAGEQAPDDFPQAGPEVARQDRRRSAPAAGGAGEARRTDGGR